MKPNFLFLMLLALGVSGCQPSQRANPHAQKDHVAANGAYYWKTVFAPDDAELDFLHSHNVKRLYLRFFDVVPAPHNEQTAKGNSFEAIPNATLAFRDTVPNDIEIVPVVFVTIEALRQMQGKEADFAKLIAERVQNMADFHDIGNIGEIQLDCDWTQHTEDSYFRLCQALKDELEPNGIQLSCTIRLWQLARPCPPTDRGVLMLYNTGDISNEKTSNSILTLSDVESYLTKATYGLPLDYAYPTFGWCVWFRNGEYMGIFHDLDLSDTTLYIATDNNFYTVLQDHSAEMRELVSGDRIRHETISFNELSQLDDLIRSKASSKDASIILYHLDSKNLSNYTDDEIRQIYHHN